ncbi:DNA adenine methylase [Chryseobacterium sp. MEBOG07]|uniref:DNA adenine methylase n=1 Tax=Chryseobacterium sp. MEBOG07 TaxID=2879939 RepID=UPI001F010FEC|nr:DNA adenine methylase [Chryseobacterium sp. MEBOG07]UKB81243.1 DNA adenine methylase [Chryseobacterium sp. MEBOG07]
MPEPKYSILNDLDDDVTNLYLVVKQSPEKLKEEILKVPISESLLKYYKRNLESDPVQKAVRFLLLSNFSYLGKGDTLRVGLDNAKKTILKNIDHTFLKLQNCKILNKDFREVLPTISFTKGLNDKENCFIYLDPVYHETEHWYKVPNWKKSDTLDCLDLLNSCGIKAAMSEFSSDFVINAATERNLNIIYLKERRNIKNTRTEILITNYSESQLKIDFNLKN